MAELAMVIKDVYAPTNLELIKKINFIALNPNLRDFTNLLNYIDTNVKNDLDKAYFKGQMDSWRRKLVYTSEVVSAIKSIEKAWIDNTQESVTAAQKAISEVKVLASREWLMEQLSEVDINKAVDGKVAKIIITQVDSVKYGEAVLKFKYKILDQNGVDITKRILASDITAQPIISYSKVTVALDPSIGIGTMSGNFSEKDKFVGIVLIHKETGMAAQLMFNDAITSIVKDITFGELKLPNGLTKIEIKQKVAAILPITAKDGNGDIIKDKNILAEEFVVTASHAGAKAYFTSGVDGTLQLELNTSEMNQNTNVIVSITNKTTG